MSIASQPEQNNSSKKEEIIIKKYPYGGTRIYRAIDGKRQFKERTANDGRKNSGRSRIFESPEHLKKVIDAYIDSCQTQKRDKNGEPVFDKNGEPVYEFTKVPCKTGLALFAGVTVRTLDNYGERYGYKEMMEYASTFFENFLEDKLIMGRGNPVGTIFALKNRHGWKDKQEIENNQKIVISFDPAFAERKELTDGNEILINNVSEATRQAT